MKYIKAFFRYSWMALDGLRKVLHLLLLLIFFALILAAASPQIPHVPTTAALVIDPQGRLVEQNSAGPLDRAIAEAANQKEFEVQLRDVLTAIHHAQTDARIKLIVLNLDNLTGGGIVKLEEVAAALREFRAAGKQVIAFGQAYDQQQYYLAAQADQIYLDPHGMVLVNGFDYYSQYFKDALDKLGVTINVFKAGKYKSAVEPFIRQDMSAEAREANQQWLGALWKTYQERVTQARGLEADALNRYAEELLPALKEARGDMATMALNRKLVSELKTREQVEDDLIKLVGEDEDEYTYRQVGFEAYLLARRAEKPLSDKHGGKVAIVVAEGEIVDGERTAGTIGGDSLAAVLRDARHDDDIKAVVLRIDSPGGSVMASEIIRREVAALKQAGKPVVASMSGVAASGGYYIAMDADEIWADRATITGSIGVFGLIPTFDKTLGKLGINTDGLGTTSIANSLRLDLPMNDTAKQVFQLAVDHEYSQFVQHVADARSKSFADIDAVAQGRVWAASDAVNPGLIDHMGLLEDAVKAAAARAQLGDQFHREYMEEDQSWRQMLAQRFGSAAMRVVHLLAPELRLQQAMPAPLNAVAREAERLVRLSASSKAGGHVYYYCGCTAP